MTIMLELTPEQQAELERRASVSGTTPSDYLIGLLVDDLGVGSRAQGEEVDDQQWRTKFHAWLASHEPQTHHVDDSRESIYD